jgi:hypothetical protein
MQTINKAQAYIHKTPQHPEDDMTANRRHSTQICSSRVVQHAPLDNCHRYAKHQQRRRQRQAGEGAAAALMVGKKLNLKVVQTTQLPAALQPRIWLQRCRVLPYLDGLDGQSPPIRAAAAVKLLTTYTSHQPETSCTLHFSR